MCEFYIYKIADNTIIALLFAMVIFYWRSAMGVGSFLNAQVVNKDRKTLIKYNQYVTLKTQQSEKIDPIEINKNSIVEGRYKKSVRTYYALAFVNITFVVLLFVLSYRLEEGIIGALIVIPAIWQTMLNVVFLALFAFLFKFSHLKYEVIGVSDESYQHVERLLLELKTEEYEHGK